MAPRNAFDGKGKFKYNYAPPNCDGFNVTHMCSRYSKDCLHGSCWHMDRVRQMIHKWFTRVGRRLDWAGSRLHRSQSQGSRKSKGKNGKGKRRTSANAT